MCGRAGCLHRSHRAVVAPLAFQRSALPVARARCRRCLRGKKRARECAADQIRTIVRLRNRWRAPRVALCPRLLWAAPSGLSFSDCARIRPRSMCQSVHGPNAHEKDRNGAFHGPHDILVRTILPHPLPSPTGRGRIVRRRIETTNDASGSRFNARVFRRNLPGLSFICRAWRRWTVAIAVARVARCI
jgi:hypothetical protein